MESESTRRPLPLAHFMPFVHSGGGMWITNLYHYLGIVIAWAAHRLGLSPNFLTIVSAVITTIGGALLCFYPQTPWPVALTSFFLIAFAYAMDCSDGQLARATKSGSLLGTWLDHTVDCWKIVFLNACLGWVVLTRLSETDLPLLLAFLAPQLNAGGTLLFFFGWNYKVQLVGKESIGTQVSEKNGLKEILLLPLNLADFGVFLFLWFLLPYPKVFLLAYAGLGAILLPVFLGYLVLSAWALRKAP